MKKNFDVTGMTCSACSNRVEKAVSHVPGVEDVNVNLLKNSMTVDYDETKTGLEQIIQIELDEKEEEQLQESIRVLGNVLDECM